MIKLKANGLNVTEDQVSIEQEKTGLLETVFLNGKLTKETTLKQIRERISNNV